jgi:hypothetical protein
MWHRIRAPIIPTVNTCPEDVPAIAAELSSFTKNGKLELPTIAIAHSTYGRRCSQDFSAGGESRFVREKSTEASAAVCGAYLAITRTTKRSSLTLSAYVCTRT